MSDELFKIEPQLSPRQAWMNEQGVTVMAGPVQGDPDRRFVALVHGNPKAFGATSREAEDAAAGHLIEELKLKHWSQE